MLALALASLLAAENTWCDLECFERSHPVTSRLGFARRFGGPEVSSSLEQTVEKKRWFRVEVGWAVPLVDQIELFTAVTYATDRRFALVPGVRYTMFDLGNIAVAGLWVSAPLWWDDQHLWLHARFGIELRLGPAATTLGVELDPTGAQPARISVGARLSL